MASVIYCSVSQCHFIFNAPHHTTPHSPSHHTPLPITPHSTPHHTTLHSLTQLNIPVHTTLPQRTQHSQQTYIMTWRDSNPLSQQARDGRPIRFGLGDVVWGRGGNQNTGELGQSVTGIIMTSTSSTVQSQATPLTAVVVINRSELSAVLVTTFHTLPAVSWLRWWLCPALLSM
jgi:hypothetical protein